MNKLYFAMLCAALFIAVAVGTNDLVFDWPTNRKGWRLIWTTNDITGQAVTNWTTCPGSQSTNRLVIPIDPNIPSAIFRLVYP